MSKTKVDDINRNIYDIKNKDEYEHLLERAKRELIQIENRYKAITELETVFDAIDDFIKEEWLWPQRKQKRA